MFKLLTIIKIISSLFIFSILIHLLIYGDNITRIIIQPFLICCLAFICENIAILFSKTTNISIFHKLYIISFLAYWFGIIIVWCYNVIKLKAYFSILFSIPFWFVGFYIIYKTFSKKSK